MARVAYWWQRCIFEGFEPSFFFVWVNILELAKTCILFTVGQENDYLKRRAGYFHTVAGHNRGGGGNVQYVAKKSLRP